MTQPSGRRIGHTVPMQAGRLAGRMDSAIKSYNDIGIKSQRAVLHQGLAAAVMRKTVQRLSQPWATQVSFFLFGGPKVFCGLN